MASSRSSPLSGQAAGSTQTQEQVSSLPREPLVVTSMVCGGADAAMKVSWILNH